MTAVLHPKRTSVRARLAPTEVVVRRYLGAIVLGATALHVVLARSIPSPWVVPDELIYSEMAKSIGAGGLPAIRDQVSFSYGPGYPLLLSPIWAVFDNISTAYGAAKVLNAFVLSLTAVPAYYLGRRFLPVRDALLVAALSVAVPSMLYAGTLMTEVALYPVFVLVLVAMTTALERPSPTTQAAVLGTVALACSIKTFAASLIPAYFAAIVIHGWLVGRTRKRWLARMQEFAVSWFIFAVCIASVGLWSLVRAVSPAALLGAYSVVPGNVNLLSLPVWSGLHLAELDLYLAILPFAFTAVVVARGLRSDARESERLFSSVCLATTAPLILVVGAFASTPTPGGPDYPVDVSRIHERSTFVMAPLFFIGLLMWLADRRGPRSVLVAAIATAAILPAAIPFEDLGGNAQFQALALVPWVEVGSVLARPLAVAASVAVVLLFVLGLRARASAPLLIVPIVLAFGVVGVLARVSMISVSDWTLRAAAGGRLDWVDRAAGRTSVSVLWAEPPGSSFVDPAARHRILFVGEFFNRKIGDVYEVGSPLPYGLPSTRLRLFRGRVLTANGQKARLGRLVLSPCYVHVLGRLVSRDLGTGARVVRVAYPLRATVVPTDSCMQD